MPEIDARSEERNREQDQKLVWSQPRLVALEIAQTESGPSYTIVEGPGYGPTS